MRGISESRLRQIANQTHDSDDANHVVLSLLDYLLSECKELNPWLPIDENTPKDRRLNLHWPGTGWVTGSWVQLNSTVGYFTHDLSRYDPPSVNPTHYQELPEAPI